MHMKAKPRDLGSNPQLCPVAMWLLGTSQ